MIPADPKTQSYHKLIIYQKSLDLLLLTYKLTRKLPKEVELYFELCLKLNYFTNEDYNQAQNLLIEVKKLIYSFQKSLRKGVAGGVYLHS